MSYPFPTRLISALLLLQFTAHPGRLAAQSAPPSTEDCFETGYGVRCQETMDTAGYVQVDQAARLQFQLRGAGPPVVFIYGFTLDQRMWEPQVEFLRRHYLTLTYDIRGFGQSSAVHGPHDPVSDLLALLDSLGIGRVHLVGMSMGGRIAIDAALRAPERIRSLTVIATTLGGFQHSEAYRRRRETIVELARSGSLAAAKEAWLHDPLLTPVADSARVARLIRLMVTDCACPQLGNVAFLPVMADPPAIGRLPSLTVPTLIISGEADVPDLRAIADTLAATVPHAALRHIKGAGHLVNLEAPDQVNRLLDSLFVTH